MHRTQLHLRIWTRIVLYYLTCTEHNWTSGFEHVSSCIISHAQNTTEPQDVNTYRPELSHMHRTQLNLRIWTRIVLYYLTSTEHNWTSGFEHVSSCIILHAQNTTAPQDLNTYRPVLSHMYRTQLNLRIWTRIVLYYLICTEHKWTSGFEHVSSCIISHAQNTTEPQDLNTYRPELSHMHRTQLNLRIWTRIVLYYLTSTEHNWTSGSEHVSSLLSHMHRTQLHLRFWTRVVLNYLTCKNHNYASGFEHVSSCRCLVTVLSYTGSLSWAIKLI